MGIADGIKDALEESREAIAASEMLEGERK